MSFVSPLRVTLAQLAFSTVPRGRTSHNLEDLQRQVRQLTARRARRVVKEGLAFTGEATPMATLPLSVMGRSRSLSGR